MDLRGFYMLFALGPSNGIHLGYKCPVILEIRINPYVAVNIWPSRVFQGTIWSSLYIKYTQYISIGWCIDNIYTVMNFVPVRTPPPAADFRTTLYFVHLGTIDGPDLYYLIRFGLIFIVTLTLSFPSQIWNLLFLSQNCPISTQRKVTEFYTFSRSFISFAVSYDKMIRLPRDGKWTYRLNTRHRMPSVLVLTMMTSVN